MSSPSVERVVETAPKLQAVSHFTPISPVPTSPMLTDSALSSTAEPACIVPAHSLSSSQQSSPTTLRADDSMLVARENTEHLLPLLRERVGLGHEMALEWGYPSVQIVPLELAWDISTMLRAAGLQLVSVAFLGGAVTRFAPPTVQETLPKDPLQLDIAFVLANITRDQLFLTRDIALDALIALLPEAVRRKARHMIAAAYIKSMFVSPMPRARTDDLWAAFSLHSLADDALQLTVRFVAQSVQHEPVQLVCSPAALQSWLAWQPRSSPRASPTQRLIPMQCLLDAPLVCETAPAAEPATAVPSKTGDHRQASCGVCACVADSIVASTAKITECFLGSPPATTAEVPQIH